MFLIKFTKKLLGNQVAGELFLVSILQLILKDATGVAASQAQKHLIFYELDLGLNHVSRKWSDQVDNGANMLVTVPGGADGPSGVLVCAENFVIYKNQGHPDVRAVIPRRADLPAECGVLIVSAAMHKTKNLKPEEFKLFFLLQTEYGDIFKLPSLGIMHCINLRE